MKIILNDFEVFLKLYLVSIIIQWYNLRIICCTNYYLCLMNPWYECLVKSEGKIDIDWKINCIKAAAFLFYLSVIVNIFDYPAAAGYLSYFPISGRILKYCLDRPDTGKEPDIRPISSSNLNKTKIKFHKNSLNTFTGDIIRNWRFWHRCFTQKIVSFPNIQRERK